MKLKEKKSKKSLIGIEKKSLYLEMHDFINGKLNKFAKIQDGINVSETLINFQSN